MTATRAPLAITAHDWNSHPTRDVVVHVRYTKRETGGWYVVRADNGRKLGWLTRDSENVRRWAARISPSAFRGDGPDDEGDLLDTVPWDLYRGSSTNAAASYPVAYDENREWAASSIVNELVRAHAPAVGYGRHPHVREYRTSAGQHFALGKGDAERCVCGGPWPDCPKRAALLDPRVR